MALKTASVAVSLAFVLAACSPSTPAKTEAPPVPAAAENKAAEAMPAGAKSVGPTAAKLAYLVSQKSPLLTDAAKDAISKGFNGAPISSGFAVHTVTAQSVSCRAQTPSVGKDTTCSISFSDTQTVEFRGDEAKELYDALGKAGVEEEQSMSHLERTLSALSCTVDDKVAQETPSTGEDIAGFGCKFLL